MHNSGDHVRRANASAAASPRLFTAEACNLHENNKKEPVLSPIFCGEKWRDGETERKNESERERFMFLISVIEIATLFGAQILAL